MTREEEIRQAARKYFDEYMDGLKGEVLTVQQTFEEGAKWADKTMIEKACNWLLKGGYFVNNTETINDFKKAMEL
jgi:predicted molibdopterin-dependent oxidoreductase YjgC